MGSTHEAAARQDYLQGMKYQDIAQKYGVSINTVKSWKTRYAWSKSARKKIKKCVQIRKSVRDLTTVDKKIIEAVLEETNLTEKERMFCLYFLKNRNAKLAAIKAGYSKRSAASIGCENLTKPHIRKEIDRLRKIQVQAIMISEEDIVERYMQIACSDMSDVAEFGSRQVPVFNPETGEQLLDINGDGVFRTENYLTFKDHDEVDGALIAEIKNGRTGMSIKLENRQKALQWLSDYFMMNPMSKHRKQYDNTVLALRKKELQLKEW